MWTHYELDPRLLVAFCFGWGLFVRLAISAAAKMLAKGWA